MFSKNKFKCCICGETVHEFGNNPFPVKDSGRCCDCCNYFFVIPARIELLNSAIKDHRDTNETLMIYCDI